MKEKKRKENKNMNKSWIKDEQTIKYNGELYEFIK